MTFMSLKNLRIRNILIFLAPDDFVVDYAPSSAAV